MNKEIGISALRAVIASGDESMSSIARRLNIDASQVSKIASGKFSRMTGNALDVCKFALSIQAQKQARIINPELNDQLSLLTAQLVEKNPVAAEALAGVLHTLINNRD